MWFRMLLVSVSMAALAACAVVDPVDNRYDTVARSLAKSRNESIFLNLVRASHDYPLSFVHRQRHAVADKHDVALPAVIFARPAYWLVFSQWRPCHRPLVHPWA